MKDFNDLYIRVYQSKGFLYMEWQGTLYGELHGKSIPISPVDDYPFAIIFKLQLMVDHIKKYEEKLRKSKGNKNKGEIL